MSLIISYNIKQCKLNISGNTTVGMLKRLIPESSLRKPDLLILTSGSNETRRLGSKDAPVTTDIKQLIKQGKTLTNVVFVAGRLGNELKEDGYSFICNY